RRQEGIAALAERMALALDGDGDLARHNEEDAFGLWIGFGPIAAAAGFYLDDILGKGLGKAAQWTGNDPGQRVAPMGQVGGDDVAHDAMRNDGIGLGENGATRMKG